MPKSRKVKSIKRKNTKSKLETKNQLAIKSRERSWLPRIKIWTLRTRALVVSIVGVVGLVSGLLVFASRVSVSSSTPLNPSDPFSTPFFISNDGLFAIYDVKFHCDLRGIKFPEGGGVSNISIIDDSPSISSIEASEKATTKCMISIPDATRNDHADIAIVISYRPKFFPYQKNKKFRFVMEQGFDKQWHWQPQPLSK